MKLTIICLVSTLALLSYAPLPTQNATLSNQRQTDLRTLMVTVADMNNAPIKNLDAASFTVTADKISQEVVEVSQPDSPLSLAIVFDLSGSMGNMQSRPPKLILDAVKNFVDLSHRANEYVLVAFNGKARLLNEPFQNAIAIVNDLDALSSLTSKGGSKLFDAMHLTINTLSRGKYAKRVILLVTDGFDYKSDATFKQTTLLLEKTDILVYPIFLPMLPVSLLTMDDRSIVDKFASVSGGRVLQPRHNVELRDLLSQVAVELRSQYAVRFRLEAGLKNKCNEFKVKVIVPVGSKRKTLNSRVKRIVCDS